MTINKKYMYLGTTLFSVLVLTSMSAKTVKADTTTDSTATAQNTGTTDATEKTAITDSTTTPMAKTSMISTSATTPTSATSSSTTPTSFTTASSTTPSTTTSTTTTSTASSTLTSPTTTSTATTPTESTTPTTSTATTTPSTTTTSPTTSTTTVTSTVTTGSGTTSTTTTPTTSPTTTTTGTTTTTSPTTGTSTTPTTDTTTITGTVNNGTLTYEIPSDVTDDTVVQFSDSLLGDIVKKQLGLTTAQDITVGSIKGFKQPIFNVDEATYEMHLNNLPTYSTQQATPIESLNGMQYLQLLPSTTQVYLGFRLASDDKANTDLTPLDKLNLNKFSVVGNFGNTSAKQIDVGQLTKLNISGNNSLVGLYGDNEKLSHSGVTNEQFKQIGPWYAAITNKYSDALMSMTNASVTDFSPLDSVSRTSEASLFDVQSEMTDSPVYAVHNQPITFKPSSNIGIDGDDLAATYSYSPSAASDDLVSGNIVYNPTDGTYTLADPDQSATELKYGDIGYTANTQDYVRKFYGNFEFRYYGMTTRPLIWQDHPTVTIYYQNSAGQPMLNDDGSPMTKTFSGNLIGDSFDFTTDSAVDGYTLTSPTTMLQGKYTQAPQEIYLQYTRNATTGGGGTTTIPPIETPQQDEPADNRIEVEVNYVTPDSPEAQMGVKATTMINGVEFYMTGYGNWIAADTYNGVKEDSEGIVRTTSTNVTLYDSKGQPISRQLSLDTAWKYSGIVTINGKDYYQVASDEFLPYNSGLEFNSMGATANVTVSEITPLYDSNGQLLNRTLPNSSTWVTDGYAMINGEKMYRVATNEWIKAAGTTDFEPVSQTFHTNEATYLYDQNGKMLTRSLPADTDWKVDRIVYIDGQAYYRVATDEYVKVV